MKSLYRNGPFELLGQKRRRSVHTQHNQRIHDAFSSNKITKSSAVHTQVQAAHSPAAVVRVRLLALARIPLHDALLVLPVAEH